MTISPQYLMPLSSSLLYVVGALMIRRSADFGVGVWRTAFVTNVLTALFFLPLLALGGSGQPLRMIWQPAVVGLLFVAGQILSLLALTRGDVSVATPVFGVKVVLVALFVTALLPGAVPPALWVAAGLSTMAVALLNIHGGTSHRRTGSTIMLSSLASGAFALFDVLVQKWSPAWGMGRFLPIMLGLVLVYSVAFVPFFRKPLWNITEGAWPWLLGGAFFIALQGLVLISALAVIGDATAINIIYSSRGLWSVVAVWWVGHWFGNTEQEVGGGVLRWRLAGALLMMGAIALVLI